MMKTLPYSLIILFSFGYPFIDNILYGVPDDFGGFIIQILLGLFAIVVTDKVYVRNK